MRAASRPPAPGGGCPAPARVASASTAASISVREVVGRRVGQRGGGLALVAIEPLGPAEALDRERELVGGGAPALGEVPRGVGVGQAGGGRRRRPRCPTGGWRPRRARARAGRAPRRTGGGRRRRGPVAAARRGPASSARTAAAACSSDEGLLELRGDLLEGGAGVAELRRLVGADGAAHRRRGRRPAPA